MIDSFQFPLLCFAPEFEYIQKTIASMRPHLSRIIIYSLRTSLPVLLPVRTGTDFVEDLQAVMA
jgi:hypothetical protein